MNSGGQTAYRVETQCARLVRRLTALVVQCKAATYRQCESKRQFGLAAHRLKVNIKRFSSVRGSDDFAKSFANSLSAAAN